VIKTIVLAAGKGSRLKSKVPKVLHKIFDKPILAWVLDSVAEVQQEEIIVVCGHKAEQLENFLHAYPVITVRQENQLGTGHAVMCAAQKLGDFEGTVLIVNGDSPLIKPETLNNLLEYHKDTRADLTVLTCAVQNPNGYGRLIRRNNQIIGIKEEKDCSEAEKTIREINAGVYCFEWNTVKNGLKTLSNNNAQEEYYLTDLVDWSYSQGLAIASLELDDPNEVLGVNAREDLAKVTKIKNDETLAALMESGVTIIDPTTTHISPEVEIGYDTVVLPGTYLHRRVTVGNNCIIGPNTSIFGPAEIGSNTTIMHSHISRSFIGDNCVIGPYAHLRDGNDIANGVRIGNFVELKNCAIADSVSAAHLSYLGDSKIKANVNIGAGTITANYDSRTGEKNQTIIRAHASTGANCVLVAPVEIGEHSLVAAGSVITEDVPASSLAIARPRQETKTLSSK
jgi:bifunctional UDP-N-acetylglucosamine pyrophosphorylase/glucosamine-1-phosphate N-acetyltransferase